MKILSLFDWMSCGQIAINNLQIKDYNYFRSEIDKYAIAVTQTNFPNTIQIWDVTKVRWDNWWEWYFFNQVDILLWWSPCQWFSFAWKQLNFEDERSKLFFEYVRILKEVKPKYFLLENVRMKKEYQDIISDNLFWIQPIEINSSLLTRQNRKRLYWVWELQEDWTYKKVEIEQPQDRWVLLKDILEDINTNVSDKYIEYAKNAIFKQDRPVELPEKAKTLLASSRVLYKIWNNYKKLTRKECCKLQWINNNYFWELSDAQVFKMLWNWWTIPVIEHILNHLTLC